MDQWFGVPMYAWNPKFFNLVATRFGEVMKIDEETLNKRNLQSARILISTSFQEISRMVNKVMVDNKIFTIRIKEEEEDLFDDTTMITVKRSARLKMTMIALWKVCLSSVTAMKTIICARKMADLSQSCQGRTTNFFQQRKTNRQP